MTDENVELSGYLDGELTPEERRRVEVRLASDPEYARELRALERVHTMIATSIVQPARHADFLTHIQTDARRRTRQRLAVGLAITVATAALIAVLIAPMLVGKPAGPPPDEPAQALAQLPSPNGPSVDDPTPDPIPAVVPEAPPDLFDAVSGMQLIGTMTGAAPSAILKLPDSSGGDTRTVGVGEEISAGIFLQEVTPTSVTLTNGEATIEVLVSHQPRVDYAARLNGLWNVYEDGNSEPVVYGVKRDGMVLTATPADGRGVPLVLGFQVMGRHVDFWLEGEEVRYAGEFDEAGDVIDVTRVSQDVDSPQRLRLERVPEEDTQRIADLALAAMAAERDLREMYSLLRAHADAHEGRFPASPDALDSTQASVIELFRDTDERKVQYVPGLSMPASTRPPEPEYEPAETYPDRLMAYEQLLARSGYKSMVFAECLVRLRYTDLDFSAEADTMGRISQQGPTTGTLGATTMAALRAKDQDNLKQLGLIIRMFENEHHGYTPPGWLMVFPEYLTDPTVLTSPRDKPQTDSYAYLIPATHSQRLAEEMIADEMRQNPAANAMVQSQIPVIINRTDWPDGGRNILYLDGHVEYNRFWRDVVQGVD
ncbi:MAG: hypothetical protein IT368_18745 [Candidatus Hydrogenedentes bacterium]|nr:hypothetical protein [Candidatus Hydrogenedentota bacterium]